MKVIHSYKDFPENIDTVVTIGTFDGVHIGHRKIIEQLTQVAKSKGLQSVVLTFFPHPRMVIQSDHSIKLIHTIDERIETLAKTDLDYLIIHPFNEEFAQLSSFEFVRDVLVNYLNVKELIIGYDHRFGKNREGDFEQLKEFSHMFEFDLKEIAAQDIDHISVSSTKIRKALDSGNIHTANTYLQTPFYITGTIVSGEQLGTQLGFPTANILIQEDYKLIPKNGAYLIKATVHQQSHWGMLNIGNRPTVSGKNQTIEAHLFDFNADIYNETIKIEFLTFLRDEQKFDDIEALKAQLNQDQQNCMDLIEKKYR